jgi:hypothetical protein
VTCQILTVTVWSFGSSQEALVEPDNKDFPPVQFLLTHLTLLGLDFSLTDFSAVSSEVVPTPLFFSPSPALPGARYLGTVVQHKKK